MTLGVFQKRNSRRMNNFRQRTVEDGFEVTVGASVDGRIGEGLRVAGQYDFLGRRTKRGMRDRNRWNGRGLGLRGQSRFGFHARSHAAVNDNADQ